MEKGKTEIERERGGGGGGRSDEIYREETVSSAVLTSEVGHTLKRFTVHGPRPLTPPTQYLQPLLKKALQSLTNAHAFWWLP